MAKEIFISYSRKDFEKVKAIKNEIDSELGIKCWMDLDGIESGEQFENKTLPNQKREGGAPSFLCVLHSAGFRS